MGVFEYISSGARTQIGEQPFPSCTASGFLRSYVVRLGHGRPCVCVCVCVRESVCVYMRAKLTCCWATGAGVTIAKPVVAYVRH